MCKECEGEFSDPTNNRFYSQTNSCPSCRISQWVVDSHGIKSELGDGNIVDFICEKIETGAVVAVKGIGGFLLICDAENKQLVNELREKKFRPTKPFALLYPDIGYVKKKYVVSKKELEELQSSASPIVLLNVTPQSDSWKLLPNIAPRLNRLGVMLAYAPVLVLIAGKLNRPLLATSGNQKGSPIIYKNQEAIKSLSGFANYFLLNNREIQIPQDDSVVKFSEQNDKKIVIRRSRGYAPGFLQHAVDTSFAEDVLSMGALLKSTFCIWSQGRCHVSQFLGDTTEFDAQISYERTLNHFQNLLEFKPEIVLVDKHPAYFSTQLGKEFAFTCESTIIEIQHHEAHLWAVLGENDLLDSKEKILGVVFDGTGMGNDGAVWGGEFFNFEFGALSRINHLKYFPHILGDKMAREPRLSALSVLHSMDYDYTILNHAFSVGELDFYLKVIDRSTLQTSSMGRIFDAISGLMGLCYINTHEGEGAMFLECIAQKYCDLAGQYPEAYNYLLSTDGSIDLNEILGVIVNDISTSMDPGLIAAKFHSTIVQVIAEVASRSGYKSIAFSGGVFQNGLLIDMIIDKLDKEYRLFFHKDISPNDECISYGQLVGYYSLKKKKENEKAIYQSKSIY
jgi:hydrogenase maturation protein HypF